MDGNEENDVTYYKPNKKYIVGSLASRKDNPESDSQEEGRSSVRARRLKVSFLSKRSSISSNSTIVVKVSGLIYYPILQSTQIENKFTDDSNEETESQITKEKKNKKINWKRTRFTTELIFAESEIKLDDVVTKKIDFSDIIDKVNQDKEKYVNLIDSDWDAEISIERKLFDYERDLDIITIFLTNNTIEPPKSAPRNERMKEKTLFDCKLNVTLHNIQVGEFVDEYVYEGYKQKYYYDFRPINCQAYWELPGKIFSTRHYAIYYQETILPRQSLSDLELSFKNLSSESILFHVLDKFTSKLNHYNLIYKDNLKNADDGFQPRKGDRQNTWQERQGLAKQFEKLVEKIQMGVNEIKNNVNIRNSFMKMNETFEQYYVNRGIIKGQWRIFQIAFVLALVPSLTQRKDLDFTDILHVNTGGGKSEAYFALVVLASFYERASGKRDGVTAIVKFPLRMLSIQQLERIASIIIYAEKVRKANEISFPGSIFSLGYFVGDSPDFPQLYNAIRTKLYDGTKEISPAPSSLIISNCPLCEDGNRGIIRLIDDKVHARIIHKCDRCHNEFLIVSSAREVYRLRPTILVSTVDKWASVSEQRRVRNLLGGKGSQCPNGHGFIPSGDKCEDDRKEAFKCDMEGQNLTESDGPLISIQDEMHLLSEGFGTISSHYEGLLESFVEYTAGRKLKNITMSATLNGAANQIQQLYNKQSFVIPGRCPEEVGGETDIFFEKKEGPKRIIYGLKPNLRDNHYASLRSILHSAEFILQSQQQLNKNSKDFCYLYNIIDSEEAEKLIKQFIIPLTYHIKKQDAYDMQKFEREVISPDLEKTLSGARCDGLILTGDSELEELKNAINSIRKYVRDYESKLEKEFELKPVYATSVVSHGVDLDELNLMIFQGLPYSTSEYIQALSRVGRKSLGIVLLWFYPNRVRDDSFYRNFIRYHETLDHQVKPVPIKRLSKLGMHQTLNSLFCGAIINYLSNSKGNPIIHKKDLEEITLEEYKDLIDFIRKCYTGKDKGGILDIDLAREIEERINHIKKSRDSKNTYFPNILKESGNYFYRNQSGMRGIQKQLILELDPKSQNKIRKGTI